MQSVAMAGAKRGVANARPDGDKRAARVETAGGRKEKEGRVRG
jgi:hypothetical protein